jgi:flagellar biosynthesis protein FliR
MDGVPNLNPLLAHVLPCTLVVFRLAGVFMMAPLLTNTMLPRRYKALLVMMLGAAVYPIVQPSVAMVTPPNLDVFGLVPLIASEALIGLAIGAIAAIPLLSMEMAGVIMGQSMGLGLAKVYNPDADFEADVLGQFLYYIGATIFVALGGLERLFGGIIESFRNVPLGGFAVSRAPLDLLTGTLASGFELAMRVSAPVVGIVMMIVVVFGTIGKTMPQLNVMSVGFAIKSIAGIAITAAAIYTIQGAVGDEISSVLSNVTRWLRGL